MTPTSSTHTSSGNRHESRSRASDRAEDGGRPSTPRVFADQGPIPTIQVDRGDTGSDSAENDDHSKASCASKGHGSPVHAPMADNDDSGSSTSDDSEDDNHSRVSRSKGSNQSDSAQQPEVQNSTRRRRRKSRRKTMGIHRPECVVRGSDPFDYEQRFPEDKRHEEMGPMARVWRTYLEECGRFDLEMVEGWRDALDVLLVFAGLFSAVVTAFVAQTSQSLQVDYGQVTMTLLIELIDVQRSMANGSLVNDVPRSDLTFRSSTSDSWVNGLWFTSLSLSLSTALFAVLTKQWIHQYMSVSSGTLQDRCQLRQFRYMGLQQWGVDFIIGLLPVLMSLSLAVFLVGLVLFIIPLHVSIACVVGSVTFISFTTYLITNFLPILYPSCPYKTPLSQYIFPLYTYVMRKVSSKWKLGDAFDKYVKWHSSPEPVTLKDAEVAAVQQYANETDTHALSWLYSMSSNPSVQNIVIQATSALPLTSVALLEHHIPDLPQRCCSQLSDLIFNKIHDNDYHFPEGLVDHLTRVCLRFTSYWPFYVISDPKTSECIEGCLSPEVYVQFLCFYGHNYNQIRKLLLQPPNYHADNILLLEPIVWASLLQQFLQFGSRDYDSVVQNLFQFIPSSYWFALNSVSPPPIYERKGVKISNNPLCSNNSVVTFQTAISDYLCPWVIDIIEGHIMDSIFNPESPNEYPSPQDPRLRFLLTMVGSPSIQCARNDFSQSLSMFCQVISNIEILVDIIPSSELMPIMDLTNHRYAVLKLLYTLLSAVQFGTEEMPAKHQRAILLLFLRMVQSISPLPSFICQDWCTSDLATKFVQVAFKDGTWGLNLTSVPNWQTPPTLTWSPEPDPASDPIYKLIHYLFQSPPIMNKAFEYAAAEHLFQVDRVIKIIQHNPYIYPWHLLSCIIQPFINGLMSPSSKLDPNTSQKFLEYLFQPDTLFAVCIPLIRSGSKETLHDLVQLRPNDSAWSVCLQRLQEPTYSGWLSHPMYNRPGLLIDLITFIEGGGVGPFGTTALSSAEQIPQWDWDVSPTSVTVRGSPKNLWSNLWSNPWHRVQ